MVDYGTNPALWPLVLCSTAVLLGTVAVAFFTNYLAVYIVAVLIVPALYLVVVLEERELRDRFGEQYVEYCRRVPRFFPRRQTTVDARVG